MKVREYKDSDYETICYWWDSWGMDRLSPEFLPKHGYIVSRSGIDYAAVWVYRTDSRIRLLECFVSNPHANNSMRSIAINELIKRVSALATKHGYVLWSSTDNIKLGNRLEDQGFQIIDIKMNHYLKLWEKNSQE
jgi:hypothetical protein